jgi:thiol-disulfide isomerase/thioredoxin
MPAEPPDVQPTSGPAPSQAGSGLLAWLTLAMAATLFLAYVIWRRPPAERMGIDYPAVGQQLLFFEVEPLTGDGKPLRLEDLRGRVTLINIWGTWCPPCAEEFPYLVAIHNKWVHRLDYQYVSISYDDKPLAELTVATAEFLAKMQANHPTYHDPGAKTLQGLHVIGIEDSFPTTLVLDKTGTIRGVWLGYSRQSIGQIQRLLNELLKSEDANGS